MEVAQEEQQQQQQQQQPSLESGPVLFFCHHCQSEYRQPKLLKCLHNFCMLCLKDSVTKEVNNDTIICPLCSYPTPLPQGRLDNLPDNPFLQRISSEYVTGVRSNLAAKSQSPQTTRKVNTNEAFISSSSMGRRLSEEIIHLKMANLTDEQKTVSSRNLMYRSDPSSSEMPPSGYSEYRRPSIDRGEYTGSALEAVDNMSRLQSKLICLQGEALRVTYAIDEINQNMTNWHQHKEDLKFQVQQRSNEFIRAAKKMERQILLQIDDKAMEDQFYAQLDRGKNELRTNLKHILHEVSVLKSVHELGRYSEINQLSGSLLGPSVGMKEVVLDMLSYQLDIPTKPIDDMMSVGFGNVLTTQENSKIYVPEIRDFTNVPVDKLVTHTGQELEQDIKALTMKSTEVSSFEQPRGRSSVSRRSTSVATGSRTHTSDMSSSRTDVQEHLEEFQTARENFRTRRQEILRKGHVTREDQSPLRGDSRKFPWPSSLRGRVQSLDRASNTEERGRRAQRNFPASSQKGECQFTQNVGVSKDSALEETHHGRSEDTVMSYPIIEESSNPGSPQKRTTTYERVPEMYVPKLSLAENADTENASLTGSQRKSSLGSYSQHSSSDESPLLSPTADSHFAGALIGMESRRQLRKALGGAADKRSKLEYLRENWQKRKEILIQSHGFVLSDSATHTEKSKTDPSSPSSKTQPSKIEESELEKEDTTARTHSDISASTKLTSANHEKQEPKKLEPSFTSKTSRVLETNALRNVPLSSPQQQTSHDIKNQNIGRNDDSEEEEIVVTSTETIQIPGNFPTDRQTNKYSQQRNQTSIDEEDEGEGEVIIETFDIGQNQTSQKEEGEVITETFNINQDRISMSERLSSADTRYNTTSSSLGGRFQRRDETSSLGGTLQRRDEPTSLGGTLQRRDEPTSLGGTLQRRDQTSSLEGNLHRRDEASFTTSGTLHSKLPSKKSADITATITLTSAPTIQTSLAMGATSIKPSQSSLKSVYSATTTLQSSSPTITRPMTTASSTMNTQSPTLRSTVEGRSAVYGRQTDTVTATTTSSTSATPISQIDTTATTTSSAGATSNSQIDTTPAAAASTTTTTTTTTSSLTGYGRYRRRYIPRTETIDVASLIANIYKTSPSQGQEDTKKTTEEKDSTRDATKTQTNTQIQGQVLSQSFLERNRSTSSNNVTPTTNEPDQNKQIIGKTVDPPLDQRSSFRGLSQKESSSSLMTKENKSAIETSRKVSFSEPLQQNGSATASHRDQRVQETFTQAEMSRRRVDPSTLKSSARSRRHTVEISKTIPEGVRLSDMYKASDSDSEESNTSTSSGYGYKNKAQTELEESRDGRRVTEASRLSPGMSTSGARFISGFQSSTDTDTLTRFSSMTLSSSLSQSTGQATHGIQTRGVLTSHSQSDSPPPPLMRVQSGTTGVGAGPASPILATATMSTLYSSMVEDPTLGQATSGAVHGKLRDIARKKKERWRRLTIT